MDTGKPIRWLAKQFPKLSAWVKNCRTKRMRDRAIAEHFDNHKVDQSGPSFDFVQTQKDMGRKISIGEFRAAAQEALDKGSITDLSTHHFGSARNRGDKDFYLSGEDNKQQFIEYLGLMAESDVPELKFSALRIYKVHICQSVHVTFENCHLGEVFFQGGHVGSNASFLDCHIRVLKLSSNCAGLLRLRDTTILGVTCPPAGVRNPFLGSAKFENVDFSADKEVRSDVQGYRNLRHHLMNLQDLEAAGLVQRVVLIGERELSGSKWYRFFSWCYQALSDFGNSVARPLGWWVFGSVGTIGLIFFMNGTALNPELALPEGSWHHNLTQPGCLSEFYRASILALDAWAGPFGVIFGQDVVAAKTIVASFLMVSARLLSTTLFALFLLALRRKFRMS